MNRRAFAFAAGSIGVLKASRPLQALTLREPESADIFITDDKRRHEPAGTLQWATSVGSTADATLRIVPEDRFQPVLGFGAAFTDAACFVLHGMQPADRQTLMSELFSTAAMNLSVGRCCVGASDYSLDAFNYDDVSGDSAMTHFSTAHDDAYILPILREARALQPSLFLLSSTWSPPGWMKVYGSMLGGWMSEKHLADYARYYVAFLESYAKKGVPIQALTTGNEVEAEQGGSMPATFWTTEMEADFLRDHLGPLLREHKLDTQIWLLDHNYDLWKRVLWQIDDVKLRPFVQGVAWHGYLGTPDMIGRVSAKYPGLPMYWTEGGPDYTNPQYETEWTRWGRTFTAAMRNGVRCLVGWNLALDAAGKPNIGPFQCAGLVTVQDGAVKRSGQFWAMRHFSQHVTRGSARTASHCDATDLDHIAFVRPDGETVCILTNSGGERKLATRVADRSTMLTLPANSIVTVRLTIPGR